jgi:hypothetical protein
MDTSILLCDDQSRDFAPLRRMAQIIPAIASDSKSMDSPADFSLCDMQKCSSRTSCARLAHNLREDRSSEHTQPMLPELFIMTCHTGNHFHYE